MKENLRKYLVEFIGTFFLMFTVACVVLFNSPNVIGAIAIGFALMVCVYAGGHISGGHYNPAVSLAASIRGALDWKQLVPYWISQLAGAGCAALLMAQHFVLQPAEECGFNLFEIITGEFLFTFLLCYVVLNVATSKKTEGNSYYGLAIGSVVVVGAFAVGGLICYGAFNPAVAFGLGMIHNAAWTCMGITAVINLLAGICAAFIFKFVDAE